MNKIWHADLKLPNYKHGLRIRFWAVKDALCIQNASRDPYIPLVTSIPSNCSVEQAEDWIHRQLQKIADGTDLPLCISSAGSDEALGMIGVFGLDKSTAHGGYWIDPEKRGSNLSGRALEMMTEWAFDCLGLEKLELFIEPNNVGSVKAAAFAGYSYERTQLSETEIAGSHRQMSVFSKMRS